jgi:hypothetical protein
MGIVYAIADLPSGCLFADVAILYKTNQKYLNFGTRHPVQSSAFKVPGRKFCATEP